MPPRGKKQSANQHDKRHESGLAPPGKRIVKKRSDNQLNGHAGGPPPSASSDQLLLPNLTHHEAAPPDGCSIKANLGNGAAGHGAGMDVDAVDGMAAAAHGLSRGLPLSAAGALPEARQGRDALELEGRLNGAAGVEGDSRKLGSLSGPSTTVVSPQSLRDVLAILFLLMQLPSSALTALEVCFAFLFMRTSYSGLTVPTSLSWSGLLQGQGGSPATFPVVVVHLFVAAIWLVLTSGKTLFLDLAQVVVAMSLGGGITTRSSVLHGAVCLVLVTACHVARHKSDRAYLIGVLDPLISKAKADSLNAFPIPPLLSGPLYSSRNWARIVLELHIISQGLVRLCRRAFARYSEQPTSSSTRVERAGSSNTSSSANPIQAEAMTDDSRHTSLDDRTLASSDSIRDGEKTGLSSKQRRKLSNLVRTQQPFWAAVASAKVAVSREMEYGHESRDKFETGSKDPNHLGNGTRSLEDCVWISKVSETEIWFSAVLWPRDEGQNQVDAGGAPGSEEDLELSLRVNGAAWPSVSTFLDEGDGERTRTSNKLMRGKVYGLGPATNYVIEFVRPDKDETIYSTSLLTRPIASTDQATLAPPLNHTLRPSSPVTTLKQSIANAEYSLAEQRARLKKSKKDHRNASGNLKRDVDNLDSRLSSYGNNDEKQRSRVAQLRQSIRQAEEAAVTLTSEVENLGDVPREERKAFEESKKKWDEKNERHMALRSEFERGKAEADRQVNAVRSELSTTRQKIERMDGRLTRLDQQRDNLLNTNEQSRQVTARRESDRKILLANRAAREQDLLNNIEGMKTQRQELEARTAWIEQQINQYDNNGSSFYPPTQLNGHPGIPQTPESGTIPASRPHQTVQFMPVFQNPIGTPPVQSRRGSLHQKPRGRSSSMLSDISGFTEDETDATPTAKPPQPRIDTARKHSGGSGSANSSQRDAASSPSSQPKLSPIGAEVGRGSPRDNKKSLE